MGEERFWCGVKQLVKEFRGRYAEWTDLERVFTAQHGSDLRWFFAQWVERAGAPVVSVAEARATPLESGGQAGSFRLRVRLQQSGQSFRLAVPLNVAMAHDTKTVMVPLGVGRDEVDVVLPERPLTVAIDPAFTVLRRLGRDQMAPVLNLFVTDRRKAVLPAFAQAASPLRELVARMAGQDGGQPLERRTAALSADTAALPSDGSVLVLATPDHREQV